MNRIILAIAALLISTSAWANVPSATPLYNQYTCNSSTTQFPYAFPITASSDMTVYLTDTSGTTTQLSNSVFSVDTTNLWVNYPLVGSPCTTSYVITLRPSTPQTQTTTYGGRAPFTATAVGSSFDKLTLISQQLQSQINRTFLQPANVTAQVTFPSSSAGSLIGWDGSGNLSNITNPSAVAQWSLSGANIFYNLGNVSTTKNFTAGSINWTNIQTLQSTNLNWSNVNGLSPINYGGINWTSTNVFPTSATGNVGIGSSNPGKFLDVAGAIRSTTGGFVFPDATTQTTASTVHVKMGSTTYDLSTSSGTQAITGVGFQPKGVIFFAAVNNAANESSWGVSDGSTNGGFLNSSDASSGNVNVVGTNALGVYTGVNNRADATCTMDSDGFTLHWTKTNSPTGTLTIKYLAIG